MKKLFIICTTILVSSLNTACTPEQKIEADTSKTNKEKFMDKMHHRFLAKDEAQREAYEQNMSSATSYTDEEKLESWRARMEQNAQTDTMGDKQKSYDARMQETQNK